MRKGQAVSIDFMTALTVFIVMIVAGFYLIQHSMLPDQRFSEQMEEAGEQTWLNFQDEASWSVNNRPIIVRSNRSLSSEPLRTDLRLPRTTIENSSLVMKGENEIISDHDFDINETLFVADIENGTTVFDAVWTEEVQLEGRNYSSNLERSGDSVWNDDLNLTFTSSGLSQLEMEGTELLQDSADLAAGSSPSFDTQLLDANVSYSGSGEKHVLMFHNSTQIRVTEFFSGSRTWSFNLTDSFDTMYTEGSGTVSLDSSETISNTDWIDFYDGGEGVSFIGENLDVTVDRQSSTSKIEVDITFSDSNGKKDLLIYPHNGDYTEAEPQKSDFYDPYEVTVGVKESTDGISENRVNQLESLGDDEFRNRVGLEGLNYNISIPEVFDKGETVETETTVIVLHFPVPVVERFGNVSVNTMKMRFWE